MGVREAMLATIRFGASSWIVGTPSLRPCAPPLFDIARGASGALPGAPWIANGHFVTPITVTS